MAASKDINARAGHTPTVQKNPPSLARALKRKEHQRTKSRSSSRETQLELKLRKKRHANRKLKGVFQFASLDHRRRGVRAL